MTCDRMLIKEANYMPFLVPFAPDSAPRPASDGFHFGHRQTVQNLQRLGHRLGQAGARRSGDVFGRLNHQNPTRVATGKLLTRGLPKAARLKPEVPV